MQTVQPTRNQLNPAICDSNSVCVQNVRHHLVPMGLVQQINGQWWLDVHVPNTGSMKFQVISEVALPLYEQLTYLPSRRNWEVYFWLGFDAHNQVVSAELIHVPWRWGLASEIFKRAYQPHHVVELVKTLSYVQNFLLQHFAWDVFSDPEIILPFVQRPGSLNNHHNWPGGLLEHSLEVARLVRKQLDDPIFEISKEEKELTLIAAVLHDIGKVMSHADTLGKLSQWGRTVDHESLGTLVLSSYLKGLGISWPWGASALTHILLWKPNTGHCQFVGGYLIKAADQLSAHMSNHHKAFANQPTYYKTVSLPDTKRVYARL